MIFTKSKKLKEVINSPIDQEHYKRVEIWKAVYAGNYDEWNKLKYHTINGNRTRKKRSLGMAKVAAEELSKLIFTERVQINIDNDIIRDLIKDTFKDNRFYKVIQNRMENGLALGGLILKANPKELPDGSHKVSISYVTPDCFVPISYENDEITEAAFLTITRKEDKTYVLIEIHKWEWRQERNEETGEVTPIKVLHIQNELYKGENAGIEDVKRVPLAELYPDLEENVYIEDLTMPLFQYVKPPIANNFDLQSPLGISIYANSLDTLYAIDTAFDSFIREFRLGKRRIIVPVTAVQSVVDPETGRRVQYFDVDDEVYQAMASMDPDKQKVTDNTVELRVDEHIAAINALLNLYSMQIGFSSGTFTFDGKGVKTATEVVSEKSKTFQTKQSNEDVLEESLVKFIKTIVEVSALYDIIDIDIETEYEAEFYWDDSIIKDKHTESDFFIKLKNAGLLSGKYILMQLLDFTEEDAEQMMDEINQEKMSSNPDMDALIGATEYQGIDE